MVRLVQYGDRGSQALPLRQSWSGTRVFDTDGQQVQALWLRKLPAFVDACRVLEVALEASVTLTVAAEALRGLVLDQDASSALALAEAARRAILLQDDASATIEQGGTC